MAPDKVRPLGFSRKKSPRFQEQPRPIDSTPKLFPNGGFLKSGVPFGGPIIGILICWSWGLYWGPLILGKYQINQSKSDEHVWKERCGDNIL